VGTNLDSCSLFGDSVRKRELQAFSLTERVYPPNFQTPDHTHENALFTFVLGGSYTETFGTRRRHCERASALFHPGGDIHAEHFSDAGGRLFIIEMLKDLTARIRANSSFPNTTIQSKSGNLTKLGARAYAEFERFDESSPLIIEGLMLEIVGEATRLQDNQVIHPVPRWLQDVEELLMQRFAEPLTLKEIAKIADVHPVHLAQTFRKLRDHTVGDRLREIRLEHARESLKFTRIPISQIAAQCGFSDQSHLSRLFKNRYGTTPRAYRNTV
jgi:AraC family transcriptional regulator